VDIIPAREEAVREDCDLVGPRATVRRLIREIRDLHIDEDDDRARCASRVELADTVESTMLEPPDVPQTGLAQNARETDLPSRVYSGKNAIQDLQVLLRHGA
jgi:hypothetical protein